ncbi:MAG: hypothetical protein PHN44_06945 [Candidatus Marinimicrobia bacterium]|nr:hypothetical protein [Candidatus Neomarinimicrobiota bacterium]
MIIKTKAQRQQFKPARGGWWLSYNERTVKFQGENGPEIWYEYDQVWIPAKTKEEIVVAIIRTKYSVNDELHMNRLTKTTSEWIAYNSFAEAAIAIADEVLSE